MAGEPVEAYGCTTLFWTRYLRESDLPKSVKAVGFAAASFASPTTGKDVRPGVDRLAAAASCSTATVKRALKTLRESGWLTLVQYGAKAQGKVDEYVLSAPASAVTGPPKGSPVRPATGRRRKTQGSPVIPSEATTDNSQVSAVIPAAVVRDHPQVSPVIPTAEEAGEPSRAPKGSSGTSVGVTGDPPHSHDHASTTHSPTKRESHHEALDIDAVGVRPECCRDCEGPLDDPGAKRCRACAHLLGRCIDCDSKPWGDGGARCRVCSMRRSAIDGVAS